MASPPLSHGESVDRDAVSKTQDIYSQALECKDLFFKSSKMSSAYATQVSACQRRFLTWTSFLGVFASESASLDRRLEFNPEVKDLVMSMLRVLKRNLERGLVRYAPVHQASTTSEAVENDGIMYGIIGAVDRLHRLAVAIRQSPRIDEVERVRNFASKQKPDGFPSILFAMVQFLFPDAERTLQVQLVESIVYRRHRMLWSLRHSKKLGHQRKMKEDSPASRAEQPSHRSVLAHGVQPRLSPKNEVKSIYSSTLPLRRRFGNINSSLLQEVQHEDFRSTRSSNPPPRAHYPELPTVPVGETKISCRYCLSDINIPPSATQAKKEILWINHLNDDLRPYTCVSEECRNVPTSFSSTKEWKAHMTENHGAEWARYIHRAKWSCVLCGDDAGFFSSEDLLVRHLTQDQVGKHPPAIDSFELAKLKLKGRAANPRQANQCPLCGPLPWMHPGKMCKEVDASSGQPDDLYLHFAAHLQYLALLAISWWDEDVGAVADTSDIGYASTDVIGFNSEIDCDQSKKMGTLIRLEDDALAELETTRTQEESKGQEYQNELIEQQKQLWKLLQPSLDDVALRRCQELRRRLEWGDQIHQDALLMQLDELHERLRFEVEAVMPQKERLNLISGNQVEPHNCDPAASSRKWSEVIEQVVDRNRSMDDDDNPVINHMMKIQEFLEEMNLPPDIIAPGHDNTILCYALRSAEVKIGPGEDEYFVPFDKQYLLLTREAIEAFFQHLIGSVSSASDGDKDSVVRYCTDQVCNPLPHYLLELEKEKMASRKKIFAVLTLAQRPAAIVSFIKEGISDLDLPIHLPNHGSALDLVDITRIECQTGRRISCFLNWNGSEIEAFARYQWRICERPSLTVTSSFWDKAYDYLKDVEPELIDAYEEFLSRARIRDQTKAVGALEEAEAAGRITRQIPQQDAIARRERLKTMIELGLKQGKANKASTTQLGHEFVLPDAGANVPTAATLVEDYLKNAVKDLPQASIVLSAISLVLPFLKTRAIVNDAIKKGFIYVTTRMRYYGAMESILLTQNMDLLLTDYLSERLVDLYKLIIEFQVMSVLWVSRSQTRNYRVGWSWSGKRRSIEESDKALSLEFTKIMPVASLQVLRHLGQEAEDLCRAIESATGAEDDDVGSDLGQQDRSILAGLRTTDPRDDKIRIEQNKGGLLKDSYRWILDNVDFRQWRDDENTLLLWIKGDPGKGKTMLLCGIINDLQSTSDTRLLSFFFCQSYDMRLNNATAVLRGLIYLIICEHPPLISHLVQAYSSVGKRLFFDENAGLALPDILRNILADPSLPKTFLIIDAIDECINGLPMLLDLIFRISSVSPRVKWIISSRNLPSIKKQLDSATHIIKLSLELNERSISEAVNIYIQHKVDQLAAQKRYDDSMREAVQHELSLNAHGTFLWVALVCQGLEETPRWQTLEKLQAFPPGLDVMYRRMIDQVLESKHAELYIRILALMSVVYRPLTWEELTSFIDTFNYLADIRAMAEIVELCGSFLTIREHTVFFIHPSAKEFLITQVSEQIFPAGIENIHYSIFSRSLQAMSRILKRDVYGLRHLGFPTDEVVPPNPDPLAAVRYSCVYWIDHLHECDPSRNANNDLHDDGLIDNFWGRSYLNWLEALSLLRKLSEGMASIFKLRNLLQQTAEKSLLAAKLRDSLEFINRHKVGIETSPLQVYASALVFSPTRSLTRACFQQEAPAWIVTSPVVEDDWSPSSRVGIGSPVRSVAWSYDTRLASGSTDETVKIWDTAAGQCTLTLEGHSGAVFSVAWSHDSLLASGSSDKTIKIWDTTTGQCTLTLEGHSGAVFSVAWSHDSLLASGSSDKTIKIWDTATGQCTLTLEGHSGAVFSVAWSYDSLLASGSSDKTIKIWDTATGQCMSMLEGHSYGVFSVAWSHDSRLASSSFDKTVRIWDTATGQCMPILNIGRICHDLQFDESVPHYLHTNIGTLDLQSNTTSPTYVGFGIDVGRTWITHGGQNILWIPPEYRPYEITISGTHIGIGCASSRVLILGFSEKLLGIS